MMAPDSNAKSGTKGTGCGGGGTGAAAGLRPPEQGLNCPRCDSLNTKFCYYNNYSLTQPRHFCKSCRRYWTKGGALRNVPVGGGCRKNRKSKSCSASVASSPSSSSSLSHLTNYLEPSKSIASMDFHFSSFFPFPLSTATNSAATASMAAGRMSSSYGNIASSIESLSSINQDLHWRLQQQRMQLLLGGGDEPRRKDLRVVSFVENQVEPICFAVAENDKGENFLDSSASIETHKSSGTGTACFLDGSFAMPAPPPSSAINAADANMNFSASLSDWNGFAAAWSDAQPFTSLP